MARIRTPLFSQISTIRRRSWLRVSAMVMTTWSISSSRTSRGISRIWPRTLHAVDHRPLLERVVVDEADHLDVHVAPAGDLARGEDAAAAGADEQHRLLAPALPQRPGSGAVEAVVLVALVEDPPQHPQAERAAEGERRVHQNDGQGDAPEVVGVRQPEAQEQEDRQRSARGLQEVRHLAQPHVAPDEAVDTGQGQRRELKQQNHWELDRHPVQLVRRNVEVEAQQVGQHEGAHQGGEVEEELDLAIEEPGPERRPRDRLGVVDHSPGLPGRRNRSTASAVAPRTARSDAHVRRAR